MNAIDSQLQDIENQLNNAVKNAVNSGVLTDENAIQIRNLYDEFKAAISKEDNLSEDMLRISADIRNTMKKLDIIFEESVKIFNEVYENAIDNGSENVDTINQLRFLEANIEKVLNVDSKKKEDKQKTVEDIKMKMHTIYNTTFFFNR